MKYNPLNCQLHSGKKTTVVAAGPLINATASSLKWADTIYYQVDRHGDYVQETH